MKTLLTFLRTTITGGILFLIPVVLTIVVLNKARLLVLTISRPLTGRMPDIFLGLDGSNLLAIFILIVVCFLAGLLFRSKGVRKYIEYFEENFLSYLPGYTMVKSIASDVVGDTREHNMKTVLIKSEEGWNLGFLVEKDDKNCVVFVPEAPRHDSGEIKIVPRDMVKILNVPTSKAARYIQRYGKGSLDWVKQNASD